ncbi:MAG: hypothetical protein FWF59_09440 [Turicibacter sp.]|nr:hypothetical protein [Turicibacter sp.]
MVETAIQFVGIVILVALINLIIEKVEFLEKFKDLIKWASIIALTTFLIMILVDLLSELVSVTGFDVSEILQFVGVAFIFGVLSLVFEKIKFLSDYKQYVTHAGFIALTWQLIVMLERLLSDIITIFNL